MLSEDIPNVDATLKIWPKVKVLWSWGITETKLSQTRHNYPIKKVSPILPTSKHICVWADSMRETKTKLGVYDYLLQRYLANWTMRATLVAHPTDKNIFFLSNLSSPLQGQKLISKSQHTVVDKITGQPCWLFSQYNRVGQSTQWVQ